MAFKKNSSRQQLIVAWADVVLADLVTTVDKSLMDLPAGAVVVGGSVIVTEVFNSTSTDVIDIGDAGSENRYKNDVNGQSAAVTALVPTGYVTTAPSAITARWTSGGGTPTTGKFRLEVQYYVRGREQFSQG